MYPVTVGHVMCSDIHVYLMYMSQGVAGTVIATVRTMRMKGIGLTAATGASREGGGVAEAAEVGTCSY